MKEILIKGIGNNKKVVTGKVIEWTEDLIESIHLIKGKIIYSKGESPLYRMAILIDNGAKAVLLEEGGRNFHPMILLGDAGISAIVGIGNHELHNKTVMVDSIKGYIYYNKKSYKHVSSAKRVLKTRKVKTEVYVNVGYPTAFEEAALTGAEGIGLFRTEFCAARTLSKVLNKRISKTTTIKQLIEKTNEADTVYAMAKHDRLKDYLIADLKDAIIVAGTSFRGKDITIRTFDIARGDNDALGNRGIRRCVAEGGHSIRVISEAIKKALKSKKGRMNIVVILPLVSHYSQIKAALDIFLKSGLTLKKPKSKSRMDIKFGWEIEQPAASQNNEIWIEAFTKEYGQPPHVIGIGTNDLTQFTIALGRDIYSQEKELKAKKYLMKLYDERDYSVIRQIYEVSRCCEKAGVKLFLLGEAAAEPTYARLLLSFGIVPSVSIGKIKLVRNIAYNFEKEKVSREDVIREYVASVCKDYPRKVRRVVCEKLLNKLLPSKKDSLE